MKMEEQKMEVCQIVVFAEPSGPYGRSYNVLDYSTGTSTTGPMGGHCNIYGGSNNTNICAQGKSRNLSDLDDGNSLRNGLRYNLFNNSAALSKLRVLRNSFEK